MFEKLFLTAIQNKELKETLEKAKNVVPENDVFLKLIEEIGEIAQSRLKHSNSINSSKRAEDNYTEELVDAFLILIDLLNRLSQEETMKAEQLFIQKIKKFKNKFNQNV